MNMFPNCFTVTGKYGLSCVDTSLIVNTGIQVFDYHFDNNSAPFVFVGGHSELTPRDGKPSRPQLRVHDLLVPSLEGTIRNRANATGVKVPQFVNLMNEAQFINAHGSKFFGVSKDWNKRGGTDATTPCEAYVLLIGLFNKTTVDGEILEQGYTNKDGKVHGDVCLVRVPVAGETPVVILTADDGSEVSFQLAYDVRSIKVKKI